MNLNHIYKNLFYITCITSVRCCLVSVSHFIFALDLKIFPDRLRRVNLIPGEKKFTVVTYINAFYFSVVIISYKFLNMCVCVCVRAVS
jgi:hypothetical protein